MRCHLPFSYEIGRGKDRDYCPLCSEELKKFHVAQSYLKLQKLRKKIREDYGVGQKTVLRAIADAEQFENWTENPAFESWFSGFFDGEGYFRVRPARKGNDGRFSFGLSLAIKLRADDADILRQIQKYFRCGTIDYRTGENPHGIKRHDQVVWTVSRQNQLFHVFIPHFERYPLRSRKAEHFSVWKEAVKLAYLKQHKTKEGTEKYNKIAIQLVEVRNFKKKDSY